MRHGIHRIQDKIGKRAVQKLRIGGDVIHGLREIQLALDRRVIGQLQLRLKQPRHALRDLIQVDALPMRLRHLGKLAEPRNDGFQIRDFRQQG